jgi:hypothetical protein
MNKKILTMILVAILGSCTAIKYTDPSTEASFSYTSFFKEMHGVQVVYASDTKVVGINIESSTTADVDIFKEIGNIITAYQ